jgi:hypothetical protein
MAILRAFILGAVIAGCLGGAAYAQRKNAATPTGKEDPDIARNAEAVDNAYKATLERTRKDDVQAAPKDPWANLRDDESKSKR